MTTEIAKTEDQPAAPERPVFDPITRPSSGYLDDILGNPFWMLDHGFIRVIDYMGNDGSIVQAARVSYGTGTETKSEDASLINYLVENKHTSPLEQVRIKFHIKAPIFVARQWLRHRMSSVNEYSGRYSIMDGGVYIPDMEFIAAQSTSNKQGRGEPLSLEQKEKVRDLLIEISNASNKTYHDLLQENLARELARIGLTLNTYTEWYWTIDAHNLFHFMRLRAHSHAQYEIRVYAEQILNICHKWLPMATAAFENFIMYGESFSKAAMTYMKNRINAGGAPVDRVKGMSRRERAKIDALFPEYVEPKRCPLRCWVPKLFGRKK